MPRITHSIQRITAKLTTVQKLLMAVAGILAILYGGVKFIVHTEFVEFEKQQKKIGREEFTRYKEAQEELRRDFEQRVRALERGQNR